MNTNDINGILIVDKEKGMTSHDVVDLVRRRFGIKKAGHAGTLDPNATGVLVLLLGRATRLSSTYLNDDKEYTAEMKLGEKTSSGDVEGAVVGTAEVNVTAEDVERAARCFAGIIEQVPPMASAKKVNGRKLYKLARKGIEIKREPVKVEIKEIEVLSAVLPLVTFRVVCSKGTYIRQLAEDIGEKLGCGAHLTELRRTRSGGFSLDRAVTVAGLEQITAEQLYENISRI